MFSRYILSLCILSVGTFGYVVNSDSARITESGWEHVFAQKKTSVISLNHHGQKSYFLAVLSKATYMQAMQFCDNLHMKLLSVRSAEENGIIHKYIRNTNQGDEFWTSGSKLLDGKNWIWMSYGDVVDYTNWAPGLLNDHQALCLQLESDDSTVYWKHTHCNTPMFFICERYNNADNKYSISNTNTIGDPNVQVTTWMQLLEHVSPNIGLLEFGKKKYYFSSIFKAKYMQAIQFCKMIKMELVTITSQEENDRIKKYIRDIGGPTNWWTSGSRLLDGKTWVWLTKGTQVEYTNWLPGEPDGDTQYCLSLVHRRDKGLYWNDDYCANQYNVICERSSSDPTEGNEDATATVERSSTPRIDIRFTSDSDDKKWYNEIRKTEPGLITYAYVEGKKFHLEVEHVATQSQAARFCEYHNMQLVSIRDRKESELIRHLLTDSTVSGPYWTSGVEQAGIWRWSSSGERMSFVNWNRNQPSLVGTDGKCIEVDEIAKWNDQRCAEKLYFICEEPEPLPFASTQSTGQCSVSAPPIVKVFISNNLITEDGKTTASERFLTSEDVVTSGGGYNVEVNNNIGTSAPKSGITANVSPYNPIYIHPDQDFK